MKSPVPGCSILITSAPCSPSSPAQNGAAMRVPRSRTRRPVSGPVIPSRSAGLAGLFGLDRVHAAGPTRLGATSGFGGVAHELVHHEVVLPGLALAHAVDGVVDRVLDGARGDGWGQRHRFGHGAGLFGELGARDDPVHESETLG